MSELPEINLKSTTLEALMNHARCMIEATVGTWILPWRATQEAKAAQIRTESSADQLRILAESQSDSLETILGAVSESDGTVEIRSEFGSHLISSQGQSRLDNLRKVIIGTAQELEGEETESTQPNPDWIARFAGSAQDVSPAELQKLWSKILAGEILNPGQTSLRTLDVLKNMSQQDASLFDKLADCVIGRDSIFYSVSSDTQSFNFHLDYSDILHIQECGLINWSIASGKHLMLDTNMEIIMPHHSSFLLVKKEGGGQNQIHIPVAHLTTAGRELYNIIEPELQAQYLEDLSTYLHHQRIRLFFLEGTQNLPNGNIIYDNKVPIEPRPILPGMPVT